MSRLIIFGATGSLGSHVLRLALAAGHEVTVFVRTPSKLPHVIQTQVSVRQGDLGSLAPVNTRSGSGVCSRTPWPVVSTDLCLLDPQDDSAVR